MKVLAHPLAVLTVVMSSAGCHRPDDKCAAFGSGKSVGVLESPLDEASGIAASTRHEGMWWVHEDSGADPILWLLEDDGTVRGEFTLSGAAAVDWEDIAVRDGRIYVADTGDNDLVRSEVVVYTVQEPFDLLEGPYVATLDGVEALHITLPGGPADIESMFVDGVDVGLLSRTLDGAVRVFRARIGTGSTTAEEVADLDLGLDPTAADLSHDNTQLIVRDADEAAVFGVTDGDWATALSSHEPCAMPLESEPQGEGIGFALGDGSVRTVGEGVGTTVWEYVAD